MSTQSIFNEQNLSGSEALAQHLTASSVDLMKYLKFELGCICHEDMREILRAERLLCSDLCYITDCDKHVLRESVISVGIRNIQEL